MKAKVKNEGFRPITIELTIESEKELCDLWHRLNINSLTFSNSGYPQSDTLKYHVGNYAHDLWSCVNEEVEKLSLRK